MSPEFPQLPRQVRIEKLGRLSGVAADNIPKSGTGRIQVEGFLYSGQSEFYKVIEQLCNIYLPRLVIDQVSAFLVLHHSDESVDVHINGVTTTVEILAKRDLQAGEGIGLSDMADVRKMAFPDTTIEPDDNIVYCFKCGWKFGLYYNFRQTDGAAGMGIEALQLTLGSCYKYLTFQEEYSIVEQEDLFSEMVRDGWFPFIQLLGPDFRHLSEIYSAGAGQQRADGLTDFLSRFDDKRIRKVTDRWWKNSLFQDHREIIDAGIVAYEHGSPAGDIACIKTLHSEIDGILRRTYVIETKSTGGFDKCVRLVRRKAEGRFSQPGSLGFPDEFAAYMNDVFLAKFDLLADDQTFSRHSALHGVAKPEDYTRARALQAILLLDQLYFTLHGTQETPGTEPEDRQ